MTPEQIKLFDEHISLPMEIAKKYSPNDAERPIIEQEARIGLAKAALNFDPSRGSPFKAYARTVISNQIRDLYTKNQRGVQETTTLDADSSGAAFEDWETPKDRILDPSPIPSHETERNEIRWALHLGIGQLTPEQGRIVEAYLNGHTFAEIARQNGTTEQNVGQIFGRAKGQLLQTLKSHGVRNPRFMPGSRSEDIPPIVTSATKSSPSPKESPWQSIQTFLALVFLLLLLATIGVLYLVWN